MIALMFNYGPSDTPFGPETLFADIAEAHAHVLEFLAGCTQYDKTLPWGFWLLNVDNFVTGYYRVTVKPIEYTITPN